MKNKKIKLLLATTMLSSFGLFLVSTESTISKKINYNSPIFSNSYFEYTKMNFSVNNKVSTPIISRQFKKEIDYLNKNRKTDINTPLLNLFGFKTKPTFVQNKNFSFEISLITTDDFETFGEPIFEIYLKKGYTYYEYFLLKFSNVKKTNNKSWFELMGIKFTKTDFIVDVDYSNSNINNSVGLDGVTFDGGQDFLYDQFPQLVNNNNLTVSKRSTSLSFKRNKEEALLKISYRISTLYGLKSDPYFAGLDLAFAQDFIFPVFNLYYKKPVQPPPPPPEPPIDNDNSSQNPDGPPEPQPEPTPPVNPDPQPEPPPEPTPPVEPDPQPEPQPEPTPPVEPDPQPEPPPEPTPPVNPDPQPEPDPIPPPEPQPDPPPAPDLNPEPQPTPEPNENNNLSVNNKMTTGLVMTLISACIMFITLLLLIAVCSVKFDKKTKSKE